MKKTLVSQICAVILIFLMSSCTPATPPQPVTPTKNPDPCAPENLPGEAKKVNDLMREFDDASALASNTPQEKLGSAISELQRIRRQAEDQQVAACLVTLKKHQLEHMNIVIKTMLAFMGGAGQQMLNDGISQARSEHDLYAVELARLLGVTLVPATAAPLLPTETIAPSPTATPTP
jgi:hypothetical protein